MILQIPEIVVYHHRIYYEFSKFRQITNSYLISGTAYQDMKARMVILNHGANDKYCYKKGDLEIPFLIALVFPEA